MGTRYHKGKGHFGGHVVAHCKVMEHSTVSCAKTAEPIKVPFWTKTRVGPRNYVLYGDADPPRERGNFWGRAGHSKHWQSSLQRRCGVR